MAGAVARNATNMARTAVMPIHPGVDLALQLDIPERKPGAAAQKHQVDDQELRIGVRQCVVGVNGDTAARPGNINLRTGFEHPAQPGGPGRAWVRPEAMASMTATRPDHESRV